MMRCIGMERNCFTTMPYWQMQEDRVMIIMIRIHLRVQIHSTAEPIQEQLLILSADGS